MLQAVSPALDWYSSNGYMYPNQGQLGRMTNRQQQQQPHQQRARRIHGGAGGGSAAAQPQSFRINTAPANSCDSPLRVSPSVNVTECTYPSAPLFSSATHPGVTATGSHNWQPEDTNRATSINHHDTHLQYAAETWQGSAGVRPSGSQYQQGASPRRSSRLPPGQTPTIRLSPNYDASFQPNYPQASHLSQDLLNPPTGSQYPQSWLQFDQASSMATYEAPPQQQMQDIMPVSPVSHHSGPHSRHVTPLPESSVRKRSYSEVSQEHGSSTSVHATSPNAYPHNHEQQHQQQQQQHQQQQSGPRKSRTIKRAQAPMNDSHKYICDVSPDCAALVFDRKCEWGKHMDKHDRPYRCPHPSCAKLQGFTYSGGLLRHEREVHHKHGGPKAFLMCPHPSCKRHTEKGFTRRENLHEHLRRVHPESGDAAAVAAAAADQRPVEIASSFDQLEQPPSALSNGHSADELYVAAALNGDSKRRRSFTHEVHGVDEVHELREQVTRLRAENEAKSATIHQLKEDSRAQSSKIAALEHALQQLQQSVR